MLDITLITSPGPGAVLTACAQWGHEAEEASGLLQESWDLAGSKMDRSRGALPQAIDLALSYCVSWMIDNQPLSQPIDQSNQSVSQSVNQSINQSINHSINE